MSSTDLKNDTEKSEEIKTDAPDTETKEDDCKEEIVEATQKEEDENDKNENNNNKKNCKIYEYVYKQQKKKGRGFGKKKVQFNSLVEIFPTNEKCKNSTKCALKSDDAESKLPSSKRNH